MQYTEKLFSWNLITVMVIVRQFSKNFTFNNFSKGRWLKWANFSLEMSNKNGKIIFCHSRAAEFIILIFKKFQFNEEIQLAIQYDKLLFKLYD